MMHEFGGPCGVYDWGTTCLFSTNPDSGHFTSEPCAVCPTAHPSVVFCPPARRCCHLWSPERRTTRAGFVTYVALFALPPLSPFDSMKMDRVLLEPVGDWGPQQSPPWAPDRSRGKRLEMIHGCDRRHVILQWELQRAMEILEGGNGPWF